ncbi:pseudaminic acid cytidylyltransferase [Methylotuvimicrobium sp. KM2]|uniref:pseudaminic acid cytidylyltransferase n=1 Tax=Methylotuvimicrobium sp. KM2 TaxID=3133976 RepID=UPI003100E154
MKIAVIPARGGSKRIPRKNIKDFCGKPIIAWSIEAAKVSDLFDHIIVSTDDEEIAEVARNWGAEVPFMRPAELSNDFTGTGAVTRHALKWSLEHYGDIECVCTLYATAPFIRAADLRAGYQALVDQAKAAAFTVTSFPYPIQRALRITSSGGVEMMQPDYRMTRSQDLEPAYHDAGQFYWERTPALLQDTLLPADLVLPIVLPRHQVQDIDTEEDWIRAELMFKVWFQIQKNAV